MTTFCLNDKVMSHAPLGHGEFFLTSLREFGSIPKSCCLTIYFVIFSIREKSRNDDKTPIFIFPLSPRAFVNENRRRQKSEEQGRKKSDARGDVSSSEKSKTQAP
jgi:hypothetical protein